MIDKSILIIVKKYIQSLKDHSIPFDKVIVFGSQAKGNSHKWSDIDTCVVSPLFGKNRFDERLMLMKLTDDDTLMIEPHPYSPMDLEDTYDPLANEIRKHGIAID